MSYIIAWNFSGLTIISLFLNQLITTSNSGCKIFFNSATVFEMTDKELSSAKLYIDALETKKKKSYIEKIKKDWSCYVALGDSRDCLLNHSVYHLYDYIDFGL